ncbi:MAG TPA: PIG-L deacetylase family protein [Acidimicrobiia bacterium]|nr:PIG-L deacetylase family protein [Acidimicrobiia bacterium]
MSDAPARVLAVGAHPDDIEFGCGATLARWAEAGSAVHLLVLTDGAKGTWDADADLKALAARRRNEQLAAAAVLGAAGVEFLDLVDGELAAGLAERRAVCAAIRKLRPHTVLGHDPWKRYRLHPDHRRAGELVLDGVVAARDPHFFPDEGPPHRPARVLLFEAEVVDHVEDAAPGLEKKIDALLCHRTQWRSTLGITAGGPAEPAERKAFEATVRREAAGAGAGWGLGLAEAYKRLDP